jgi:hypothetical protein
MAPSETAGASGGSPLTFSETAASSSDGTIRDG